MSPPAISKAEARRRISAIGKALKAGHRPPTVSGSGPTAIGIAANALDMPRQTLQASLGRIARLYNLDPDWTLWRKPKSAGRIDGPAPVVDRQRQREKDELASLRAEVRVLNRTLNDTDDLRQALFGLAAVSPAPPRWQLAPKRHGGPGVPVLFTSDFQWGEVVRREEVDGINEYNIALARRRYRRMIETTLHLCFDHTVAPKYPGIVYLRGGDAINGEIHEEFIASNELLSVPSLKDLCETECAGIDSLLSKFGRVQVYSVPGNHGRTVRKSWSAGYADTNYETLLAWMIEREFKNEKRVRFVTPVSGDVYFSIYGTHFLLTHGDRIGSRGGQGFIGPQATILRGHYKVRDQYSQMGLPVDCVLTGHFHTRFTWDHGIANGSLVGFNAFAKNVIRARPEPASQTLFFCHEKFGLTHSWPVWVDDPPPASDMPWISDRFMAAAAGGQQKGAAG